MLGSGWVVTGHSDVVHGGKGQSMSYDRNHCPNLLLTFLLWICFSYTFRAWDPCPSIAKMDPVVCDVACPYWLFLLSKIWDNIETFPLLGGTYKALVFSSVTYLSVKTWGSIVRSPWFKSAKVSSFSKSWFLSNVDLITQLIYPEVCLHCYWGSYWRKLLKELKALYMAIMD